MLVGDLTARAVAGCRVGDLPVPSGALIWVSLLRSSFPTGHPWAREGRMDRSLGFPLGETT